MDMTETMATARTNTTKIRVTTKITVMTNTATMSAMTMIAAMTGPIPIASEIDENCRFPEVLVEVFGDLGLLQLWVPQE